MIGIGGFLGGIGSIGLGAAGLSAQQQAYAEQKRLAELAVEDLKNLGIPSIEAQKLVLERFREAGQYTPELDRTILNPESEMKQISTDPQYKDAQLNVLNKLKEIEDSGGQTLEDRAALDQTMGEVASRNRGAQEAILQDQRNRGLSGSGMELAARMQAQQAGAQNASQQGLQNAANAQNRALQAILQRGQLGGQMQQEDFSQKTQVAQAQDLINRFNTGQRADVQRSNVLSQNDAQKMNLQNKQSINNANTEMSNREQTFNKGLLRQNYQDQLEKLNAINAQRTGVQSIVGQAGQHNAKVLGGVAQGVGQLGAAFESDRQLSKPKKNITGGA